MRAILATPEVRPLSRRDALLGGAALPVAVAGASDDPDAALFAAAAALARCDAEHDALWRRVDGQGGNPHSHPEVAAAGRRLNDSGARFARTPARSVRGLALKLRHIVVDVIDGHTPWTTDLVRGALADAERMGAGMGAGMGAEG